MRNRHYLAVTHMGFLAGGKRVVPSPWPQSKGAGWLYFPFVSVKWSSPSNAMFSSKPSPKPLQNKYDHLTPHFSTHPGQTQGTGLYNAGTKPVLRDTTKKQQPTKNNEKRRGPLGIELPLLGSLSVTSESAFRMSIISNNQHWALLMRDTRKFGSQAQ